MQNLKMIGLIILGVLIAMVIYHASNDYAQKCRLKNAMKNGTGAPAVVTTTQQVAAPATGGVVAPVMPPGPALQTMQNITGGGSGTSPANGGM